MSLEFDTTQIISLLNEQNRYCYADDIFIPSSSQEVEQRIEKGMAFLDGPEIKLFRVRTKEQMIRAGVGTKWSVSSPDAIDNTFNDYYYNKGCSFCVAVDKNSDNKYLIVVRHNIPDPSDKLHNPIKYIKQVFDKDNKQLSQAEIDELSKWSKVFKNFKVSEE
jgi:hypothetical protein